jgi:DNA sulfur modification protein DndC
MIPQEVRDAQVIFVNHSGGKDSQAMLAFIRSLNLSAKIVIVHSDLGEMEWEPMHGFISKNSFGLPVNVIVPKLSFFDLCRKYARLPGGQARFCTDQLKTQPIAKWIREYCEKNGITRAINAIGIRAEESSARAKKDPFHLSKISLKKNNLEVFEWYPIFNFKVEDVWSEIRKAGQEPHPIYSKGFSRLSCVFCVFGRVAEHKQAAILKPDLFEKMVSLEKELGKTIRLKQVNGQKVKQYLEEYRGG